MAETPLIKQVNEMTNPRWAVAPYAGTRWAAYVPGYIVEDRDDERFNTFEEAIAYADKEARKP